MADETDYTTKDFYLYGTQITYQDPNAAIPGEMESYFYAIETDVDGLWKVYWDAAGTATSGTQVVLKTISS